MPGAHVQVASRTLGGCQAKSSEGERRTARALVSIEGLEAACCAVTGPNLAGSAQATICAGTESGNGPGAIPSPTAMMSGNNNMTSYQVPLGAPRFSVRATDGLPAHPYS
jgi:hypothetical protein